jgi:hypothetical protein
VKQPNLLIEAIRGGSVFMAVNTCNDHTHKILKILKARRAGKTNRLPPPNLPLVRGRDWKRQPQAVVANVARIYATKY